MPGRSGSGLSGGAVSRQPIVGECTGRAGRGRCGGEGAGKTKALLGLPSSTRVSLQPDGLPKSRGGGGLCGSMYSSASRQGRIGLLLFAPRDTGGGGGGGGRVSS